MKIPTAPSLNQSVQKLTLPVNNKGTMTLYDPEQEYIFKKAQSAKYGELDLFWTRNLDYCNDRYVFLWFAQSRYVFLSYEWVESLRVFVSCQECL